MRFSVGWRSALAGVACLALSALPSALGGGAVDPHVSPFVQQGKKLAGRDAGGRPYLGADVALSADGETALVGGPYDDHDAGAAWVFTHSGSTWKQQGPKLTGGGESRTRGWGLHAAQRSRLARHQGNQPWHRASRPAA